MVEIGSPKQLRDWLEGKPQKWAQVIAVRSAMRAWVRIIDADIEWIEQNYLSLISALSRSWVHQVIKYTDDVDFLQGLGNHIAEIADMAAGANSMSVAFAADSIAFATLSCVSRSGSYASDAFAALVAINNYGIQEDIWRCINQDCQFLLDHKSKSGSATVLARESLWHGRTPPEFEKCWRNLAFILENLDISNVVWVRWFDRRIEGARSAFNIPGDINFIQDKIILSRFAAANQDYWSKGAYFVNTTLQGWIDEARGLVASLPDETLPEAPVQDRSAVAYGVNQEGKVDRLPASNQQHLRDQPDQRQIYADVRESFDELRAEGQRLGETLTSALDRIMGSMPEAFEDAQAYLVWRDGNRLRRLYLAHRSVALTNDPDPARLESAIAEQLGGALDLFNLFVMGDDGLRAKDEATIPFQERAKAETEAALAKPVVAAMLDNPAILTEAAFDDLQASIDDGDLPSNDPYASQSLVQSNRTWRNVHAAMFTAVRSIIVNGPSFGAKEAGKGVFATMGGTVFTDVVGATHIYWPMIEFVATNATALSAYAATAFSNYRVDLLIDAVLRYFKSN